MQNDRVHGCVLPTVFSVAVILTLSSTTVLAATGAPIVGNDYDCVSRPTMAQPPAPSPVEPQKPARSLGENEQSGTVHLKPLCSEGMVPVPVPAPGLNLSKPDLPKGNPLISQIPSQGLLEEKNFGDLVRQNLRAFDDVYWKERTPQAPVVSSSAQCDGVSSFGTCYYYAAASSRPASASPLKDGGGMTLTVARPAYVNTGGPGHTLDELSVQGGGDDGNIVEVGWNVSTDQYGNAHPHLFVFHWKNWQPTCYDACGWQQWSNTYYPGMDISALVGGQVRVFWVLWQGNWWAWFDNDWLGYFPSTEWSGQFTTTTLVQWFGEVASQNGIPPKTKMGKGLLPTNTKAAQMKSLCLVDSNATSWSCQSGNAQALGATVPKYYDIKKTGFAATRYGGPGR